MIEEVQEVNEVEVAEVDDNAEFQLDQAISLYMLCWAALHQEL